jgi:hypothetical protein
MQGLIASVVTTPALTGKAGYYSGLVLNPWHLVTTEVYRGRIPWLHWAAQNASYSIYAIKDQHAVVGESASAGVGYTAYVGSLTNGDRLFIETSGFTV